MKPKHTEPRRNPAGFDGPTITAAEATRNILLAVLVLTVFLVGLYTVLDAAFTWAESFFVGGL